MKTNNIEDNSNVNENNAEQSKNTSYLKVMLIFCAVMAIVVLGMNYLLKNVF